MIRLMYGLICDLLDLNDDLTCRIFTTVTWVLLVTCTRVSYPHL